MIELYLYDAVLYKNLFFVKSNLYKRQSFKETIHTNILLRQLQYFIVKTKKVPDLELGKINHSFLFFRQARDAKRAVSIGFLGNIVDVW